MTALNARIAQSTYLTDCLNKSPALATYLETPEQCEAFLKKAIITLEQTNPESLDADIIETQAHQLLRDAKREFALVWSIAHLTDSVDFHTLGQLQTTFAQVSIAVAFKLAVQFPDMRKHFPLSALDSSGILPGVFVLGLGKLGGYDLNFSSDVDLVAFYDKARLPDDMAQGQQYAVSQLLAAMTKLLDSRVDNAFVWRVDWRLRPDASVHYLTQSTDYAENFYHFHAQPWHRLALIKARVVAGDIATGTQFLADLESFLWRKNIDYREIDEIAQLKKKINLEHPKLRLERKHKKEAVLSTLDGFNVKLGAGGIREIEFIVNALQLLWGGKKPQFKQTNTLDNLTALGAENLLPEALVTKLRAAYIALRQCENCLQIQANQQVHIIPSTLMEREALCALLDTDWETLEATLCAHRQVVSEAFNGFFAAVDASNSQQLDARAELEETLEAQAATEQTMRTVSYWFNGFGVYGVSPSQSQILTPLAVILVEHILQSEVEINHAVETVHQYFTKLPLGGQYLRMLQAQPHLLDKLITPLLLSPAMTVLLEQSPHIIDQFVEQQLAFNPEQGVVLIQDKAFVLSVTDYEERLERLRRITNENLYAIYLAYLEQKITHAALETALSDLAEHMLIFTAEVVQQKMGLDEMPIGIIGLGKLGIRAMGPKSDIDVVYVFHTRETQQVANQFVSRLSTALHLQMREGRVYEMDDRLRPYGKSGSPTISISSFDSYQNNWAKTWEHLALVSGRFIVGPKAIQEGFETVRKQVLSRPRQLPWLMADCSDMLRMIREQRIQTDTGIFAAKLISGGLMELEYVINCLFLRHGAQFPELFSCSYAQGVAILAEHIDAPLMESLLFLRKLQVNVRLLGHGKEQLAQLPIWVKQHLIRAFDLSAFDELAQQIARHTAHVNEVITTFFAQDEPLDTPWQLAPVKWLEVE